MPECIPRFYPLFRTTFMTVFRIFGVKGRGVNKIKKPDFIGRKREGKEDRKKEIRKEYIIQILDAAN